MAEPWVAPLAAGDPEGAWDLFIERYRRLVFSAIRRYTTDPDDVMDVFARVCEALRENDFARLRRAAAQVDPQRRFSTWLVVVVRNLTVDWFRHRDGRPRLSGVAAALPHRQRRIFEYVFLDQRSHVEAYELLCSRDGESLSFAEFLKELSATYRAARAAPRRARIVCEMSITATDPAVDLPTDDPAALREQRSILAAALGTLPADDRLAVQLYVVDDVPAEQVARALGYGSAKQVYNHVYRALAAIRAHLERTGIRGGDL
jgi:RNA polymerase sigma factor (sigma-70 family)